MRVYELLKQINSSNTEKIMKEQWFPYLWETDEAGEAFSENYVSETLFTLWNTKPNYSNTDTVRLTIDEEDGYTYRDIFIFNENDDPQSYLLRTWSDFLGLTIESESFERFSNDEIGAILLAKLQSNHTEEDIVEIFDMLNEDFRQAFYEGPQSLEHQKEIETSRSFSFSKLLLKIDEDSKKQ